MPAILGNVTVCISTCALMCLLCCAIICDTEPFTLSPINPDSSFRETQEGVSVCTLTAWAMKYRCYCNTGRMNNNLKPWMFAVLSLTSGNAQLHTWSGEFILSEKSLCFSCSISICSSLLDECLHCYNSWLQDWEWFSKLYEHVHF